MLQIFTFDSLDCLESLILLTPDGYVQQRLFHKPVDDSFIFKGAPFNTPLIPD